MNLSRRDGGKVCFSRRGKSNVYSNWALIYFHDKNLVNLEPGPLGPGSWAKGLDQGAPGSSCTEDLCSPTMCKGGYGRKRLEGGS